MDTGIENRSYSFPYLDMRQLGGRYSDVGYLLFLFCKNRVAPRSHSSRHGVKRYAGIFHFLSGKFNYEEETL